MYVVQEWVHFFSTPICQKFPADLEEKLVGLQLHVTGFEKQKLYSESHRKC